jgi:hypothetical protein
MRKRDRDRAEALCLAGGPPPSLRDRAVALAREGGEVRTRDLTEAGIPRCYLSRMCEEGLLVRSATGGIGPPFRTLLESSHCGQLRMVRIADANREKRTSDEHRHSVIQRNAPEPG